MTKKPTFVSDSDNSDTGEEKKGGASSDRLFLDPAAVTRVIPDPDHIPDQAKTRLVGDDQPKPPPIPTTADPTRTRVLATEPAPDLRIGSAPEPAATPSPSPEPAASQEVENPTVGWMVIVDGPGRGHAMAFSSGMNSIGRGPDNDLIVDFGDEEIAIEPHAFIVYDDKERAFHATHAGQNSLVRVDGQPLLAATPVDTGSNMVIGETTLRLATFCGPEFDWSDH